jgi:hypothetical protein
VTLGFPSVRFTVEPHALSASQPVSGKNFVHF